MSSKRPSPSRAARPARATFLETVLRKRQSRFRKCLQRASSEAGEKEIHDLRVSIRRLLAGFAVLETLRGKAYAARSQRRLKALMSPLGRLRDAQVKMHWLTRNLPEGDDPSFQYALSVGSDLEKWRKRALAAMRDADPERFDFVPRATDFPSLPPSRLRRKAASLLRARRREVEAFREEAAVESRPESLHRMRLAFKRYRYCAEIFAPLFPRVTKDTLDRLHSFQTLLGELHDFDVILEDAGAFLSSVLGCPGDPDVLTRFQELRHREFRKVREILGPPDGLARHVFGGEFERPTRTGRRGSRSAASPGPTRETPRTS